MRGGSSCVRAVGFTLIELTIVLAVIATLSLVLTPSVVRAVNDARLVRAQGDTEAIFAAITRFSFDNGFFPQWLQAEDGGPGLPSNRVDLLVGEGRGPLVATDNLWTMGTSVPLDDQLLANAPGYAVRTPTAFGWNGPYLSGPVTSDPWGNRYLVNIGLIDTSPGPNGAGGSMKKAVWVITAGPDGMIDTPPIQALTIAELGGDDIGARIQ